MDGAVTLGTFTNKIVPTAMAETEMFSFFVFAFIYATYCHHI